MRTDSLKIWVANAEEIGEKADWVWCSMSIVWENMGSFKYVLKISIIEF